MEIGGRDRAGTVRAPADSYVRIIGIRRPRCCHACARKCHGTVRTAAGHRSVHYSCPLAGPMQRPRRFARIIVVYVASLVITVAMLVWWIIAVLPYHWAVLTGGSVLLGLLIVGLTFQLAHALGERNYSRRQEEFVSNITHEMKSPLAAIKLHAQTLEQIAPDDEQQSVHFILQSVARMETLVDNVLESSRLMSRKSRTPLAPTPLRPFFTTYFDEARRTVESRGLAFAAEVDTARHGPRQRRRPAPGDDQPGRERRALLAQGRRDPLPGRRRGRRRPHRGRGRRRRHPAARADQDLRPLLPDRPGDLGPARRHRPGPGDCRRARQGDERRRESDDHRRQARHPVRDHPAPGGGRARDARSRRAHPAGRGRGSPRRGPPRQPAPQAVRRRRRRRRPHRAGLGAGAALRPHPARHPAARDRRLRGLPAAAPGRQLHADPDAHGAQPAGRRGLRPQARRRRLRHQAVRPRRAAGADRGPAAAARMVAAGARGQRRPDPDRPEPATPADAPDRAEREPVARRRPTRPTGAAAAAAGRPATRGASSSGRSGSTSAPGRRARGRAWSSSRARSWRC